MLDMKAVQHMDIVMGRFCKIANFSNISYDFKPGVYHELPLLVIGID